LTDRTFRACWRDTVKAAPRGEAVFLIFRTGDGDTIRIQLAASSARDMRDSLARASAGK
jgi:hypothetical protein